MNKNKIAKVVVDATKQPRRNSAEWKKMVANGQPFNPQQEFQGNNFVVVLENDTVVSVKR